MLMVIVIVISCIFVQVCEPREETECRELYDQKPPSCNIVNEEKCETVYETGYKEDCTSTKDQELCRDVVRQVTTVNINTYQH